MSLSSVFIIIKEASAYTADIKSFSTSHKKCSTKEIQTDLDDFDKCTIRLIIYEYQFIEGETPTFKVI